MTVAPLPEVQRVLDALDRLSPHKRRTLARLLEEVVSSMGGEPGAAPMFFEAEVAAPDKGAKRHGS